MAIGDVLEIDIKDIQNYVENGINGKKPNNSAPISTNDQTSTNNVFYVTRQEYIDYLLDKRDSERRKAKRSLFWYRFSRSVIWVAKLLLVLFFGIGMFWLFYFIVWFLQNSLYFYIR